MYIRTFDTLGLRRVPGTENEKVLAAWMPLLHRMNQFRVGAAKNINAGTNYPR